MEILDKEKSLLHERIGEQLKPIRLKAATFNRNRTSRQAFLFIAVQYLSQVHPAGDAKLMCNSQ
jgi:hypothetical protein